MNNLVKILLGVLLIFIIILCIIKQPLNKCHNHYHKEGIDNTVDDSFDISIKNIEKIVSSMQPTVATQASSDTIISMLNDIKKNLDKK